MQNATNLIADYALFHWPESINQSKNSVVRGLQAYRANASAMAERALQAAYPVLHRLLGPETFAMLARDLWAAHPPERGDLAHWGGTLPAYLQSAPALADLVSDHSYLPDVARLEWALHSMATAADAHQDSASFARLASQPPEALHLRLSTGTQIVESAYPIVAIWQAHAALRLGPEPVSLSEASPDLSEATRLLAEAAGQTAMVWREGFVPRVRAVGAGEAALLQSVLAGGHVSAAVAAALQSESVFDVSAWLTSAVHSGLVLGVESVCV
jgi:hypothetical protein